MKLIIDIPETLYEVTKDMIRNDMGTSTINKAIANGIPYEPKTGHWITKDGKEQGYDIGGIKTWYIQIMCDKCGFIKTAIEGHTGQYHYCPNCGAKMVEPQESDHKCHTCKHYTKGEHDGSCGSYICKGYSDWESEDKE